MNAINQTVEQYFAKSTGFTVTADGDQLYLSVPDPAGDPNLSLHNTFNFNGSVNGYNSVNQAIHLINNEVANAPWVREELLEQAA